MTGIQIVRDLWREIKLDVSIDGDKGCLKTPPISSLSSSMRSCRCSGNEVSTVFTDYAGGSAFAVGPNCIPLQRRCGLEWPTVEIVFDKRSRPALGVNFAMLPEVCSRQTEHGTKDIPRPEANVVEGPVFFILCKGQRTNFDCDFGYHWFALRPKPRLDREVAVLGSLLPWLFSTLEKGIPEAWYKKAGYVDQYAFHSRASRIFRDP